MPGVVVPGATKAAASGASHVTVPTDYDAILLASFGGPEGQDDVIPFLRNVTRGRGIPEERLEEVAHHYRAFGGVSPINEHNRELKAAIELELARRGIDLPVFWGNRNWAPYLRDAVTEAHDAGHRKLIAIGTSAYSSYSSCRQYREDFAQALAETGLGEAGLAETGLGEDGLGEAVQIDKVRQFFDHPGFVTPFVEGTHSALDAYSAQGFSADEVHVLFSTHSIPTTDAERSGPRGRVTGDCDAGAKDFGEGGAYAAQHRAVAEVIMADRAEPWSLVYQSRSGPPSMPWLEPDINDRLAELASGRAKQTGTGQTSTGQSSTGQTSTGQSNTRAVIIVPLGFVSDHLEVKWDLDTEALQTAESLGLTAVRVPTPGVHAAFVSGLVDLVVERIKGTPVAERPALTELGPWYDVCRPGCCENVRSGFKPALAGVAP